MLHFRFGLIFEQSYNQILIFKIFTKELFIFINFATIKNIDNETNDTTKKLSVCFQKINLIFEQ